METVQNIFPASVAHHRRGSGGEYEISGRNRDAVESEAERIKTSIDYMRSPHKRGLVQYPDGRWLQWVTYYGLD